MRHSDKLVSRLLMTALGVAAVGIVGCASAAKPRTASPTPSATTESASAEAAGISVSDQAKSDADALHVSLKGASMKSATQIDISGSITFESGRAQIALDAGTRAILETLTAVLKDNPDITSLSVEGYTDNAGESAGYDNQTLSQRRAEAVIALLTSRGIEPSRLQATGYGSMNPVAPNDSAQNMRLNRRVEFHVLGFKGHAIKKGDAAPKTEPQKSAKLEGTRLVFEGSIDFDGGKATLKPSSTSTLESVKEFMAANPSATLVRIEGHTATSPGVTPAENLKLSGERSMAVVRWLVDRGIARERLLAVGFGEDRPVATNDTSEGKAKNRRVEMHLAGQDGKPTGGADPKNGGTVFQ